MRTLAIVVALGLVLSTPARARERSAELDLAQRALARLRYEEARGLLERAWQSGDNGPRALALLFRLQGEVAATIGDLAAARRAFARWLALEPDARLEVGASPRFVGPFEAAHAELAGAALRVDVEVGRGGREITLVVLADPLAMAAGARVSYTGEDGVSSVAEGKGGPRVRLPLPGRARLRVVVAALDAHGNRLVERELVVEPGAEAHAASVPAAAEEPANHVAEPLDAAPPAPRRRSTLASPWLWAGVGAGLAVTGGFFAWRSEDAEAELAELNASSSEHSFSEALAVEDRRQTSGKLMVVSAAAAGACLVAAILLALDAPDAPDAPAHLGLRPLPGGGHMSLAWSF